MSGHTEQLRRRPRCVLRALHSTNETSQVCVNLGGEGGLFRGLVQAAGYKRRRMIRCTEKLRLSLAARVRTGVAPHCLVVHRSALVCTHTQYPIIAVFPTFVQQFLRFLPCPDSQHSRLHLLPSLPPLAVLLHSSVHSLAHYLRQVRTTVQ